MKLNPMPVHARPVDQPATNADVAGDAGSGPAVTRGKAIWSAPKLLSGALDALEKKMTGQHTKLQKGIQNARAQFTDAGRMLKANVRGSAAAIDNEIKHVIDPHHGVKQRLHSDFDLFE